jgi:hypothetical protein
MTPATCLPLCALFGSFCAPTSWGNFVFVRLWKRGVMCMTALPRCQGVPTQRTQSVDYVFRFGDVPAYVPWDTRTGWNFTFGKEVCR